MKAITRFLLVAMLLSPALTAAQMPPSQELFSRMLFPPELILNNQMALQLDDSQRARIVATITETQQAMTDVQVRLGAEMEKMWRQLSAPTVDEAAVLALVDRILDLERQVKKRQIAMLIRIRNLLTPQQREKLGELRRD